jgi:hypothetical protein
LENVSITQPGALTHRQQLRRTTFVTNLTFKSMYQQQQSNFWEVSHALALKYNWIVILGCLQ